MPGRHITDQQRELYMTERRRGRSQRSAAAQAGISERSGRTLERNPDWQPAGHHAQRAYRTRADPFAAIWASDILPLLEASPGLQATTILAEMQARYPGCYGDRLLRTLQRRLRTWRAVSGPEREIFFPQTVEPGWQVLCDFTVMDSLKIRIAGTVLAHRLAHVRLRFSGWAHAEVVLGGESYTALASALVNAFALYGGVPETLRTDSLSAAFANRSTSVADDARTAFAALCAHYGITPTRNNRGKSHENGGIESPNGHLKTLIDQALLLRGDRDFPTLDAYRTFVASVVAQANGRRSAEIARERPHLRPLPAHPGQTYSVRSARVSRNGTIDVARCTYSVPSRLRGHQLTVHLFDDRIACYVGTQAVYEAPRLRPPSHTKRVYQIDYRHVITALLRKPGALRALSYRDALHPDATFARAWQQIDATLEQRRAAQVYLEYLRLAALHGEAPVRQHLETVLATQATFDPWACEAALNRSSQHAALTQGHTLTHAEPAAYDALLPQTAAASVAREAQP